MQKTFFSALTAIVILSTITTGCTKETIKEITHEITHDTTIVRSPSNLELITGKWNTTHHEYETYLGSVMTSKKLEYFTTFYLDLKSDGNYSVNNQEGITTGKWELASANNVVFDKGTTNERYFYVIFLEQKTLSLRGPFKVTGEMKSNYLTSTYYRKP
jgi:hypothetical protein